MILHFERNSGMRIANRHLAMYVAIFILSLCTLFLVQLSLLTTNVLNSLILRRLYSYTVLEQ